MVRKNISSWVLATFSLLVCIDLAVFAQGTRRQAQPQKLSNENPKKTIKEGDAQFPELVLQNGHISSANSIDFSSNGSLLVSGGVDGSVKLWEVKTGRMLRSFDAHRGEVENVSFMANDKLIVSTSPMSKSSDDTIRVSDVRSGELIRTFASDCVERPSADKCDNSMPTFREDGLAILVDLAPGKNLRLWNALTNEVVDYLPSFNSYFGVAEFSDNGDVIVLFALPLAQAAKSESTRVWDIGRRKVIREFQGRFVALSPDGRMVVLADFNSNETKLIQVESGDLIHTFPRDLIHSFPGDPGIVFSSEGVVLSVSGKLGSIEIFDPRTKYVAQIPATQIEWFKSAHFSRDGKRLALQGSHLELWSEDNQQWKRDFRSDGLFAPNPDFPGLRFGNPSLETGLSFDETGTLLAVSRSGTIDRRARGSQYVTKIVMIDTHRGEKLWGKWVEDNATPVLKFGEGGKFAYADADTIRLCDARSGVLLGNLKGKAERMRPAFSADGRLMGLEGMVEHVVDEEGKVVGYTGNKTVKIWDLKSGNLVRDVHLKEDELVDWSMQDSNYTRDINLESGTLDWRKLWPNGRNAPYDTIYSPNRRWKAARGGGSTIGDIYLYDTRRRKGVPGSDRDLYGPTNPTVAFSPQSDKFAMDNYYGVIGLFAIGANGFKRLSVLEGHVGGAHIDALVFSPDGKFLLSSGSDASTRIWSVKTGKLVATLTVYNDGNWMVVAPNGLFDGSSGGWKQLLWRFYRDTFKVQPLEAFFRDLYYPGLLAHILSGAPTPDVDINNKDLRLPKLNLSIKKYPQVEASGKGQFAVLKIDAEEVGNDGNHKKGSGVRDVRLFRNGSLVKIWPGELKLINGKVELEAEVPLVVGDNVFTSYAFNNDDVKSEDSPALKISGAVKSQRRGTLFILAIGINEYANPFFNLRYAKPDAEDLSAESKQQQLRVGTFEHIEVISLNDGEATKRNILLALRRFRRNETALVPDNVPGGLKKIRPVEPEDAVLIFFAGHGLVWPLLASKQEKPRFYLIPHDLGYQGVRAKDKIMPYIQTILDHSISEEELGGLVAEIDAGRLFLIIDACNSGKILEAVDSRQGPMNIKGLAQLAYDKGMYVLTAAQSYQAAIAPKRLGHGYLTYALEKGLKTPGADKAPTDGNVTVREWLDYATILVPKLDVTDRSTLMSRRERRVLLHQSAVNQELQQPRAFYRRDLDLRPLIMARFK